ncbi:BT_3928 family protein [Frigoriflavimonas asaccharolytica]|uniref:Putative membrane protein YphA (DoxX/SURF4 family) n=1 Tax=Frigoriflavimonas asaccharolytica TaxID=2735899 RepID=A0A8J8GBD8_9FLAO|nr:BT_3928 family protein [Frigoriflavimonas asaccharolytica]NRS92572.1 putative membrane protein YphA (DoxX/SURF4 family) [Frigoriflavimonas asaccharolytica]
MLKKILRILLGFLFILSGFVKTVDLVGFSFKLEEYFEPPVFNIPFMIDLALPLAIFVVGLELLLGLMLLLKIKLKNTILALIALCIFFGFLTFYSAFYNVVTDCGCFGDAIKFTPWQSFWKDMILLFLLIFVYILYSRSAENFKSEKSLIKLFLVFIFVTIMTIISYYGIFHEPLIDFRDYKIGTNLNEENKKILADPSEYKTFYMMTNKKTKEELVVNQDDYVNDEKYWKEGSDWEIVEGKNESKLTKQGYKSEIGKFRIEDENGMDATEQILKAPKAVLIFSYKPDEADAEIIAKAEAKMKENKGAILMGISTKPKTFKTISNAKMDGTAMKTIARSNPFILILKNGIIVQKLSAKDYIK